MQLSLHRKRCNAKNCVVPYKPTVWDYVVVAPRTKMSTNWIGPRRVSRILSDFTVQLENHFCCPCLPHQAVRQHFARNQGPHEEFTDVTDRIWYSVDKIKGIRKVVDGFEVLVDWKRHTNRW